MSDDRKPLWPWIVALLIGLPVVYVASFGPACWLADRHLMSFRIVVQGFPGLCRSATHNKQAWGRGLRWYANAWKSAQTHEITWDLWAANLKLSRECQASENANVGYDVSVGMPK